jgi:hypothetical protein
MTNPLIPFLIRHGLAGGLAGWLFVGALLALDVSGLGTLVFGAPDWWLPLGLLLFGVSVTFGSLAMGAGIMGLGRPPGPGISLRLRALARRLETPAPRTVTVRVRP